MVKSLYVLWEQIMKRLLSVIASIFLLSTTPLLAVDCPSFVKQALAATKNLCQETGSNQACYGNINLQAKPQPNAADFTFNQPGDQVNVSDIKSLALSPMTIDRGEWGVALMNVKASLKASKTTDVTVLAFGDVIIENNVPVPTAVDVRVSVQDYINVRLLPNTNAGAVGVLSPGQTATAIERLNDRSWIRVVVPDSGEIGWVRSDLLDSNDALQNLNVVDGKQPNYRPMQAFTFKSGAAGQDCSEIPQDGLIIQTPEGAGEVQLWINQVVVKLGSTVFFQAQPEGDMVVTTLEGHATVEAMGITHTAVAGSSVRVQLDANMNAISGPSLPQAYDVTTVQHLPIDNLQRKITVHPPLTADEVVSVQQSQTLPPVINTITVNNGSDNNGNNDNCPGNSCHNGTNNNNGNNDTCPGNSCHDGTNNNNGNGNNDECPGNSCHNGTNNNNGNGNGNGNGN